ncbi:MAG: acyl carrier protein [Clostridia bacterium]|nr:acyl carrier protein [Clostridia bacterium]
MLERIAEILKANGIEFTSPLKKSTELVADLNLNSFNIIELASVLEDEFGVEIPDRSIKDMKTIGDVIDLIESLQ